MAGNQVQAGKRTGNGTTAQRAIEPQQNQAMRMMAGSDHQDD
jgi:hypothetical protein